MPKVKFGTSKKFGRKKGRTLSSPASRASSKKKKKKEGFSAGEKQKRIANIQSRQKQATAQQKTPEQTNKFKDTFQATKGATTQQEKEEPEKKGFLKKAVDFLKDPTGVGKQITGIEERSGEQVFGATSGALGLASGPGTAKVGSGFGATGAWLSASKLKSAEKALKLGTAGKAGIITNTKNAKLATEVIGKRISLKSLAAAGGAIAGAASSMFLGLWAQAEAPEPISIVMRDVLREAERTGNFALYDEAKEARDEIINLNIWQNMIKFSPFSPAVGIPNKIKGVAAGAIIQDKLAEDLRIQQETGESEDDRWARVREEQAQQERDNIDYYNQQRQQMVIWENEAESLKRNEDAAFWAKQAELQREKEEEDRQAIADFWQSYREEAQERAEDDRPSKLNFGLI